MTTYGAGLRLSEACHLKSRRHRFRSHDPPGGARLKGAKDRYTLLSPGLLRELRRYWIAHRPKQWRFAESAQCAVANAAQECGSHLPGRQESRRHHQSGRHPRAAPRVCHAPARSRHRLCTPSERLLGHGSLSTTARYFHLAQKHLSGANSPLDLLTRPASPAPVARRARASASSGCGTGEGRTRRHLRASRRSRIKPRTVWLRCSTVPCARLRTVAPRRSAATLRCVNAVARCAMRTTPAATGIARSARPSPKNAGWPPGAPSFCRCHTFIWCLHCRMK